MKDRNGKTLKIDDVVVIHGFSHLKSIETICEVEGKRAALSETKVRESILGSEGVVISFGCVMVELGVTGRTSTCVAPFNSEDVEIIGSVR